MRSQYQLFNFSANFAGDLPLLCFYYPLRFNFTFFDRYLAEAKPLFPMAKECGINHHAQKQNLRLDHFNIFFIDIWSKNCISSSSWKFFPGFCNPDAVIFYHKSAAKQNKRPLPRALCCKFAENKVVVARTSCLRRTTSRDRFPRTICSTDQLGAAVVCVYVKRAVSINCFVAV